MYKDSREVFSAVSNFPAPEQNFVPSAERVCSVAASTTSVKVALQFPRRVFSFFERRKSNFQHLSKNLSRGEYSENVISNL